MFRWRSPGGDVARLMLAQLFLNSCVTGMRMAAPLQSLRHGHGEAAVGCLIAMFAVSQVFLAMPAGRYCEREGLKRPLMLAASVAVASCAMAGAWPVFPVLCASGVLTGGAGGVAIIAVQSQVPRIARNPTALRDAFSWIAIGLALSNVLGPLAVGIMIDRAGFGASFAAAAVLPLLALLAIRRIVDPMPTPLAGGARQGSAWTLWRDAGLRRLFVVTCVLSCAWDMHAFLVPVLGHERGLSASVIGGVLGGFGLGATAVRLLAPMVAAHLREWAVLSVAMTATATVFCLYPMMHNPLSMGVCSTLLGLSLGSTQPMVMSLLHRLAPEHRYGEAIAIRVIVNNASSVGIPMVSGLGGTLIGAGGVFWAAGLMVAAGARLTVGLKNHAPH